MTEHTASVSERYDRQARAGGFVRVAKSLAAAGGSYTSAAGIYASHYPGSSYGDALRKAAVGAGHTGEGWGAALTEGGMATSYLALIQPRTVLGRLPLARRVPFNVELPRLGATPRGTWTGQGSPIRVVNPGVDTVSLPRRKVAAILVVTDELAQAGGDLARAIFERILTDAATAALDAALLDPALAEADTVNPASLTHGVPAETAGGRDADAVTAAVAAALDALSSDLNGLAFVTTPRVALFLARLRFPSGERAFPEAGAGGGAIHGAPLLVSPAAPAGQLTALDGERVAYALDAPDLASAQHAILQMDDDPSGGPGERVSLWGANSQGVRVIVPAYWTVEPGAVAIVTGLPA